LDWSKELEPLAGIDADSESLGVAAVDLLVGQLHAYEYGVPKREKIVSVTGRWVSGSSLADKSSTVKQPPQVLATTFDDGEG
jgi:hypothetical protein